MSYNLTLSACIHREWVHFINNNDVPYLVPKNGALVCQSRRSQFAKLVLCCKHFRATIQFIAVTACQIMLYLLLVLPRNIDSDIAEFRRR